MKRLILLSAISLSILCAIAQPTGNIKTIKASFSRFGITSGDTTFFSYSDYRGTNLQRFFNRNLRVPPKEDFPGVDTGSCNLYFIIDTAGNVTKTWCDSVTNKGVEKEVLRVAGKLVANQASLKPTIIKGKPVITEVMAKVIMMELHNRDWKQDELPKADLIAVWQPRH
jgi:hypothetical protein